MTVAQRQRLEKIVAIEIVAQLSWAVELDRFNTESGYHRDFEGGACLVGISLCRRDAEAEAR